MEINEIMVELKTIIDYKDNEHVKYYNMLAYYLSSNNDFSMDGFIQFLNRPFIKILMNDVDIDAELINKFSKFNFLFVDKENMLSKDELITLKTNVYRYLEGVNDLFNKNKQRESIYLIDYEINNTLYSDIVKYILLILYLNKNNSDFVEIINGLNNYLIDNEIELTREMDKKSGMELCKFLSLKFSHYITKNPKVIKPVKEKTYYTYNKIDDSMVEINVE